MGIETIAQLFLILRDSAAVNTTHNINWDHEIQYSRKNVPNDEGHMLDNTAIINHDAVVKHMVITMSDTDQEFYQSRPEGYNYTMEKMDLQWIKTNYAC
jgi:hypothetical protein